MPLPLVNNGDSGLVSRSKINAGLSSTLQLLTADTTYYVSTTGSDVTGDGSAINPWKTPQFANDHLAVTINGNSFVVTIQFADGTYPGPNIKNSISGCRAIYYRGNIADQTKVIFDDSATGFVALEWQPSFGVWQFGYITFAPKTAGNGAIEGDASSPASVYFINFGMVAPLGGGSVAFANFNSYANITFGFDFVTLTGGVGYTISGTWTQGILNGGNFSTILDAGANTFIAGCTFTDVFQIISCVNGTNIVFSAPTGTFTGKRFAVTTSLQSGFAVGILSGTAGLNFFPGTIAGTIDPGGNWYENFRSPKVVYRGIANVDSAYQYVQPVNAFNVTVSDTIFTLLLDPAAGLATGTVTMMANPIDGQIVKIKTSQTITALTLAPNAGQSVLGALTTLAAGNTIDCLYRAANTTWYC